MKHEYDWDKINEIANNNVDILSVVETYQDPVKTSGSEVAFHCCNNRDSDPSLFVNTNQNFFKCFSCGNGGNALTYLIKEQKLPYKNAVETICQFAGIDKLTPTATPDGVKFFRQMKLRTCTDRYHNPERVYMDHSEYLRYAKECPEEWVEEGIDPEVMDLFDVRIDRKSNRIVYPVYDADGNFITAKGRTRYQNYKVLGIAKYINYTKIGTIDFFAGMEITKPYILQSKRIILTEGIKSVYKLFGWGYRNCAAAETSSLNEYQIRLLISMKLEEVVIAFDADKNIGHMDESVNMLKRFTRVTVVKNRNNLLGEKDAPVDKGRDVFEMLLGERVLL